MKMKAFEAIDMTVGEPWKQILKFTVPMLMGNVVQQLYSTVDSIVVGRYVGDNALAAVGSAAPIFNLLLVLFIGISMGATIMVAQYLGARDRKSLSWTIGNCFTLILIASIAMTVIGVVVTRPMLVLLRTPESILDWCADYLIILFIGSIGLGFYNILSGVLRGMGDAVSALVYLIVASIINILLDILFVAAFGMGVAGVALATIIAQGISAILCINRLRKMSDVFDFGMKYFKWDSQYAGQIIRLGLPSGITQAIFSMSIVLVQSLTNSFGEQLIAANVIVQRVDGFAVLPVFSFGAALTTYAGQNIGAGDRERVEKGSRQGLFMSLLFSVVIVAVILLFGKGLMSIFTTTKELVDLGMHIMRILAAGYILMAIIQALTGVMRGAGDTVTPMWISIIETFFLRMPLAYIMVYLSRSEEYPIGNQDMIYWSLLIAWGIGALMSILLYKFGSWRKKGIVTEA
ncbi:MAG: MATE family efflux transporter [Butyrivibrio sp.]|uniref:MATE family efflux transporter n=1 Tax=Butyrivibrio sp. TaxID=28121 RepID=UPI001B002779|nr:MATE family efflux transporter [Butyrivibrio sp.]MBO6240890.1 MATE family efflux transporter [Butyrivibrio sp.]